MIRQNKSISKSLYKTLLARVFIMIIGFSVSLFLLFGIVIIFGMSVTWYDSLIYRILSTLYSNAIIVFFLCWLIGVITILWYYWKKAFRYIDTLVEASNQLVDDKETRIDLPEELLQVEVQMNKMKQEALANARIAKEAEQRKNDLVVYLAHDLKTPLTSVIGYLTLLHDEQQISDELREKYLSISMDKALRLEELINEFFEITRFNLSHISLEFSSVNLSRMLEQIVYEFKPILDSNNLISSLQIEPNFEIKCDVNKMERVFDNLIRNAINYSVPGTTIEIIVTRELNNVSILFRNHGKTIPKEKLNRVFEQFYRLDSARVSKTGGAGLGLAIAKEIVEHHNGSIRACSENDMVEFIITLPLHL